MASAVGVGSEENDGIGSKDKQKLDGEEKVFPKRKDVKGVKSGGKKRVRAQLGGEDGNLLRESELGVMSGDSSGQKRRRDVNVAAKGGGFLMPESKVLISLQPKSKEEARDLKRRLEGELGEIRSLVRKMEEKEVRLSGGAGLGKKSKRGPSLVDSTGVPRASKSLNQLNVPVVENNPDGIDKEKRLPKANNFYKNADFLLAKDRMPPMESNKKPKPNAGNGKKGESRDVPGLAKFPGRVMKSCTSLLDRLMKHKHGWVFNKPVDTVGLGLLDYHDVIKTPMDLGTVKSRLSTNWYKSAKEFAEDVRLTFQNAMTYNPRGQDVFLMAEELSGIFENKWAAIEADYMRELMLKKDNNEVGLPVPKLKKRTPVSIPPPETKTLGRTDTVTPAAEAKSKPTSLAHSVRASSAKKPKARDPDKRDMTYDEKQKLSSDLQNLPSEKLENVVLIIRKRNPSLFQNDDEIEVDIDSVDTETLWELDRFVTNFKKSVSKSKRQAELANQLKEETVKNDEGKGDAPAALGTEKPSQSEGEDISSSHVEAKPTGSNGSRSSKSSGSDANSESDSGSSSGGGSDV